LYSKLGVTGTTPGTAAFKYNQSIRLGTLEHALLPALLKPQPMFKDLLEIHFARKRQEIEAQCRRWVAESRDARTHQAAEKVLAALRKIDPIVD
jgi:uncharacterized protein (DUF58 family)